MRRFLLAVLRREAVWIDLQDHRLAFNVWGQGRYWAILGTPPKNLPGGVQVGGRVFLKLPLSRRRA